jgi:Zn finger protein HypA/HybF involved in hydrogenase expression
MHEASLVRDLVRAACVAVADAGAERAVAVGLSIGGESHIDPETLRVHFLAAATGTPVEDADLIITKSASGDGVILNHVDVQ